MRLRSLTPICAIGSIAVAAAVLGGWVFQVSMLKFVGPDFDAMNVNSAIGFALAGASLLLLAPVSASRARVRIGRGLALTVALTAGITLGVEFLIGQLGIDEPRITETGPRRPAISTAVAFVLIGIALLKIDWVTRRRVWPAELLALLVFAIAWLAVVGYVLEASIATAPFATTGMTISTACTFFMLCVGVLVARQGRGMLGAIQDRMADRPEQRIYAALALSLFALGGTGAAAHFSANDSAERSKRVEHSHEVRRVLALMLSTHQYMETGERNYVITARPEFLQSFDAARTNAAELFGQLARLVQDNSAQAANLAPLNALRGEHINWSIRVMDIRRSDGAAGSELLVASGEGTRRMDALREAIARMDALEAQLLAERFSEEQSSVSRLNWTMITSTVLSLFLAGFAGLVLHRDLAERKKAERNILGQLEHMNLLDQLTRAIGERMNLPSIFQVVVRTLEDKLPVDFCCIGLHDQVANALRIECFGIKDEALATELALAGQALIGIDANSLGRCMQGQLGYEPDIGQSQLPFSQRLAAAGLRSLVLAPLRSESRVFGVLVAARAAVDAFSSVECEFLRQLSEHMALAANQTQLYDSLQQAYDELRQTQQAVMQQERLRALGQMAGGIAHDINNALSPVSLYTESLLETEKNLSERARGYLQTIQRAIADVAQTVSRMREFYRPREEQVELAPVDLNEMVRQVIDLTKIRWSDMELQGGNAIRSVTELASELPSIMGVESEIRDALTNLVLNAVDAMPKGGTLTLRTRRRDGRDAAGVVVEVADSGAGMTEETRLRCLEPFFTTKGERGTGLGLAMVFGMVQRHSAEIEIDSAPGQGSTLRLVFDQMPEMIVQGGPPAQASETSAQLRLLLVDDDPILLKSLRETLETDGHSVVTASGGAAGIAAFEAALKRGESFAAVVTDLGMPAVDGRKVAAAIKQSSSATPVIMITGWGRRLIEQGDIPAYVDRVLAKPPKLRELREALAQLCCAPDQRDKIE